MHVIDLEGDGDQDIFGALDNHKQGQWLALNHWHQWLPSTQNVATTRSHINYLLADFDQDGDIDSMVLTSSSKIELFENNANDVFYQTEGTLTDFKVTAEDVDSDSVRYSLGKTLDEYRFTIDEHTGRLAFRFTPYANSSNTAPLKIEVIATQENSWSRKVFSVQVLPDLDFDGTTDLEDSDRDGDGVVNQEDAYPLNKYRW
jgi:hypothetical protein